MAKSAVPAVVAYPAVMSDNAVHVLVPVVSPTNTELSCAGMPKSGSAWLTSRNSWRAASRFAPVIFLTFPLNKRLLLITGFQET